MSKMNLDDWLSFIEKQHHTQIELGLDRVNTVKQRLDLSPRCPVIVVGGTNGKGSTCAYLASILRCAGYKVGLYTSPHLLRFNERAQINGVHIPDDVLVHLLERVEQAKGQTSLTYFEWTTLALVQWFVDENVDVMVLEVGMGGRLDAVNVFDADCAILTNVDLDHQAFLGDTREAIGFEKAGIFRVNKPAICVDPVPPASVLKQAKDIGADLWRFGVDFGYVADTNQWNYKGKNRQRAALAYPALRGTNQLLNATGALAALEALDFCLPVSQQAVREGFARVELSGRFQVLAGQPTRVLDVAHNPHAAAVLAQNLSHMGFYTQTHAVIGILADKDVLGTLTPLADEIDVWYAAPLPSDRSLSLPDLLGMIRQVAKKEAKVLGFDRVDLALAAAENQLKMAPENPQQGLGERLVVFGSFLTVSAALDFYQKT